MKLNETWYRITKDPKELEYIESVITNQFFSEALRVILEGFLEEEEKRETEVSQYESPAWAYAQADRNGAKRAYRKLLKILSPSKGKS